MHRHDTCGGGVLLFIVKVFFSFKGRDSIHCSQMDHVSHATKQLFLMVKLYILHAGKISSHSEVCAGIAGSNGRKGSNDAIVGQNVVMPFCKILSRMITCKTYLLKVRRSSSCQISQKPMQLRKCTCPLKQEPPVIVLAFSNRCQYNEQ